MQTNPCNLSCVPHTRKLKLAHPKFEARPRCIGRYHLKKKGKSPDVIVHALSPALRRQRQEEDVCKFKSNMVYIKSSRPAKAA